MTKVEAIENIMKKVEAIRETCEYEYIGVRVQDEAFTVGEILNNSYVWIDGEMTEEELDGTCAIKLEEAELAKCYFGEHVAIIAGDGMEYGTDLGEIIIKNAEVIEVVS